MTSRAGQWPVEAPVDLDATEADQQGALHLQWAKEQARRHLIRDSVRQHLAELPTPRAVREVLRNYQNDFSSYAADAIAAMTSTETTQ